MKYYKLMNKNEKHYDFQYKDGLNIDTIPFDPSGSCRPGGLYFSDSKHILVFLRNQYYIREVTLPDNEEVYEDPYDFKYKAHSIILGERRDLNELSTWDWMIKEGIDIHVFNDFPLIWASANGHLDIIEYLAKNGADIHAFYDCALRWAANNGHLDIVKYLVDHGADIHAFYDCALRWATENGHSDVVEYLKSIDK